MILALQAGITAVRRVRKSDNNRIARASGATIVNRTDELREEDIGTKAGLFEIKKVFSFSYRLKSFCLITFQRFRSETNTFALLLTVKIPRLAQFCFAGHPRTF